MNVLMGSSVESFSIVCGRIPAYVNVSIFRGSSGTDEVHLVVRPTAYAAFADQLDWIGRAYQNALSSLKLDQATAVFRRFSCSDLSNQAAALRACPLANPNGADDACAVSWVRQAAAPPAKAALWAYHVSSPGSELDKTAEGNALTLRRGALSHHWTTGVTCPDRNTSYDQTRGIFENYEAWLHGRELTLADNVIRTWFFVQNVDLNYHGLVQARKEFFAQHGLTADTHYIASTGIEGAHADLAAKVAMDAYAISGVQPGQIEYLSALDHLSPTHVYGVTFERGTSVAYSDRKHLFLSGTASIDREGRIVHPGDVSRQLDRTIENMEALLKNGGADWADMCMFIVYVRDPSDLTLAFRQMRKRFGETPVEIVVAPVCRPGWLIEVEGIAIAPNCNPALPDF